MNLKNKTKHLEQSLALVTIILCWLLLLEYPNVGRYHNLLNWSSTEVVSKQSCNAELCT